MDGWVGPQPGAAAEGGSTAGGGGMMMVAAADAGVCFVLPRPRVQVEIMGSQKYGIVGKSQPVLIVINPIIFTRPPAPPGCSTSAGCAASAAAAPPGATATTVATSRRGC
jgi:hypothetical protein